MKTLEVLSYNIEFGRKFEDVVDWIRTAELSPDIFCFQEFPQERIPFFESFLYERGYGFVFTPSITLRGIPLGELTAHKLSQFRLVGHKELELGIYAWEKQRRVVKGQRSALITAYRYGEDAFFSVGNVHLSNFSPNAMRYKQLQMVIEEMRQFCEDGVIVGDFNYTSLLGVRKLFEFMDTFGFTCVGERMITHKLFKRIPQQLDYVFQKGLVPENIAVLKVPHSDHLPISVKFTLS